MASEKRFGFEWNKYNEILPEYEHQFLNWTKPLKNSDYAGKRVLDAGCGMGRNSYWPASYGAKMVVGFDYDIRSVKSAKHNLAVFNNAEIIFNSIYDIDYNNEFDIVFSIGVIHHLKNPKLAISNLIKATSPGGRILIWVYSYEGNEWIVKYINPLRKIITSKLPVGIVHSISYLFSMPLYIFVKIFKGPSKYLKQLSKYSYAHIHSIVFDQLIPEIANYWTKEEAQDLFKFDDIKNLEILKPKNNMGWIVTCIKKS